jgi:alpha-L-fucosidase
MEFELKFPKCSVVTPTACLSLFVMASALSFAGVIPESEKPAIVVTTDKEPITPGKFQPSWDSLRQYQTPTWFSDAKFGIWICYGPQCEPEQGDWYARGMYIQGSGQNKFHVAHYGPPSQFGFKDLIPLWKSDQFNADDLVSLYQKAGAQFVFVMANHHDNLDLYDSKYQPWNSVAMGPHRDIVGEVAAAVRRHHLRFGVSVHAAHAWMFYEPAQGSDKTGPYAGIPYDGRLTKADGVGKWWNGLDPQDLYAQNHPRSAGFENPDSINQQWDWGHGASLPDAAYCQKFYNRTMDLIHKYKPDAVYFDDSVLPLHHVSDAGLKITADFYNSNTQWHGGDLQAVVLGKKLDEQQRKCLVWDIERGTSNRIEPIHWQTDTCIGDWHYSRSLYDRNGYKSAAAIIRVLADVVSKNGNLMLNIPVRGNGSIDEKETAILQSIAAWMSDNRESIFGTRPWKRFGEGPTADAQQPTAANFNESHAAPFTADDIRFTRSGETVYAIVLGTPRNRIKIKSLGTNSNLLGHRIGSVHLLGDANPLIWSQSADSLTIEMPPVKMSDAAVVFKISP